MGLFKTLLNQVKATAGYQQSFEELLSNKDVARAIAMMKDYSEEALKNLTEYNEAEHNVMKRRDKPIFIKGVYKGTRKKWKLPISYQKYINEISVSFLLGKEPLWLNNSQEEELADYYKNFVDLVNEIKLNSRLKEAKRMSGAEGSCALLFHIYRENNESKIRLKVLCRKYGDEILAIKDQYGKMQSFAWSYYLTEDNNQTVKHVDIYTSEKIYRCKRKPLGWDVKEVENFLGKIPCILFEQEKEWDGQQPLIGRIEDMESKEADINDKFANPALVATEEIINDLPDRNKDEANLFILKNGGSVSYLTMNEASESKENQFKRLDKHILTKSFTPDLDPEKLKELGNISGKTLEKIMFLGKMKADKRKETWDDYMERIANILKAFLGNIANIKDKEKYDKLIIGHEFQDLFTADGSDVIADLSKQFNDGALSRKTYLERSYLISNAQAENERLKEDEAEAIERQKRMNKIDVFEEGAE
jgi:hypothetical protein